MKPDEPRAELSTRSGELREARRRRYFSGLAAERVAALWLRLKGYRILGTRVRTAAGEIDLIALRGNRLAFVEVKRRASAVDEEGSVSLKQRRRVRSAAKLWLARQPRLEECELHFDLVLLVGRRLPRHLPDGL